MAIERANKQPHGTANVLKQTKSYENLVQDYGEPAANGLLAKAINNVAPPGQMVTDADVGGFSRVTQAMRSNPVNVQATADQAMAEASAVAVDWLSKLKEHEESES
jgi:hypothetical protein